MKQLCFFSLLLALLLSSVCAQTQTFLNKKEQAYMDEKQVLNVYVEPDIYFYTYTYDNYLNGYAIHYLRLLAKKLNSELRFIFDISPEEAKKQLALGMLDIALLTQTYALDEREFQLSKFPVGVLQPALLMPKIYQTFPDLASMEKVRIAVVKESGFDSMIRDKNPDANIESVESIEELVEKVRRQEVDCAIGVHEHFHALLESKRIATLQSIPLRNNADFPILKLVLATDKENIRLISILNKAMAHVDYSEMVFARKRFFPSDSFRQTHIKVPLMQDERFFLMGKQMLNVCVIPRHLPYGDIVKNHYQGIGADTIKRLENDLDIPIQLLPTQDKEESFQALSDKQCDFIAMTTPLPDAEDRFVFTSSFLDVPLVVLTSDDKVYVPDFKTIQERSFVIHKEHPMIETLRLMVPLMRLDGVESNIEGLKRVENGEYYGFITSNLVVSHLFQHHLANRLKVSAQIPLSIPFGFAILKENEMLHAILEQSIKYSLKSEMETLVRKWVPERSPKGFDYHVVLQLVLFFMLFSALSFALYFEMRLKKSRLEVATQSLDALNQELESRIKEEVKISREKDMVMYRQSRFASMGEMIGNIAHQWRQPLMELSAILMELQAKVHFKKQLRDEEIIETISSSNRVIQFMSHTIDDFRNFFSPQKEFQRFCINAVVKESLHIMNATFHHHRIEVEVREHLLDVMANGLKNEYAQVMINLLSNAKDILVARGIVKKRIVIEIDEDAMASTVVVWDNAGGIEEENLAHIFEPFFTKEKSNGTGIGLFMSRMIVENNMHGSMSVKNKKEGALFCVRLPKVLTP
ncbi:ATP-binding protein [Sulfurospirillum deleyianum]|nr:transporter substrate-binding domain-containing protein [Sulfurospirillum deleyianum]